MGKRFDIVKAAREIVEHYYNDFLQHPEYKGPNFTWEVCVRLTVRQIFLALPIEVWESRKEAVTHLAQMAATARLNELLTSRPDSRD